MAGGIAAWNGLEATGAYDAGLFLIENLHSFEELSILAWQLEDGAREFYEKASTMMHDEEIVELLSSLVISEERHKDNIASVFARVHGGDIADAKSAGPGASGLMEGGIEISGALDWIRAREDRERETLELAMQMETNSLDLYLKISREIDDNDARAVFASIIREEKAHLARLGSMIERYF
jgi:rubrerythrin